MKRQLGISVSAWDDFMYRLKALSERKVRPSEASRFVRQVFQERPRQAQPKSHERAMGKVLQLFEGAGRGATLASSHNTVYGLLNAVTEFVDHERRARSADHRLDSAWFGQGAALKQKAMDQTLLLAAGVTEAARRQNLK